uniref:Uncharacterized protein n=1 Tax=Rhizophora mucronata TaxID=61149 RepID=A0A2P2QV51_RHIMU
MEILISEPYSMLFTFTSGVHPMQGFHNYKYISVFLSISCIDC